MRLLIILVTVLLFASCSKPKDCKSNLPAGYEVFYLQGEWQYRYRCTNTTSTGVRYQVTYNQGYYKTECEAVAAAINHKGKIGCVNY